MNMKTILASSVFVLLVACGGGSSTQPTPTPVPDEPAPPAGECVKSGCSSTLCVEPGNEMVTTCEWKAEYACYQQAACERQADGSCGWTPTPELEACLASPPQE
jgi:hypothetical protein